MTDTIRESIIKELKDLFEEYTFESITSPAVYRGRAIWNPTTEPPPLISLMPRIEESHLNDYGMSENTMMLDVVCLEYLNGQNASELGEAILGELISCVLGKQDTGSGGEIVKLGGMTDTYADTVMYRSGGIAFYPEQREGVSREILEVGITVSIKYQTNIGDPYTNN
jgi:hypothetical protein